MTLVDSNVILDIVTRDPAWFDWSLGEMEAAGLRGKVAINDIVYAEISVRFPAMERLDEMLDRTGCDLIRMPRAALFMAGKAFERYRAQGGLRPGVLPDFFIGAHAAVARLPLLSRDRRRYRTYFPTIALIAPPAS